MRLNKEKCKILRNKPMQTGNNTPKKGAGSLGPDDR